MAARRKREPDPPTQLADLLGGIERDGLARGYLLRGEERWFRDRALDAIRARAASDGLELRLHDGEDPDFDEQRMLGDLGGGGLFASRQLVAARNVDKQLPRSSKDPSPLLRGMLAFLKGDDVGTLVVSVRTLRADHALAKAIQAAGGVTLTARRLYDSPGPWERDPDMRRVELVRWLVGRSRELGVPLRPEQAVYVAAATGNDLYALEDQLERLREAPEGSDVTRLVAWEAAATPWEVAATLAAGDLAKALAGVEGLFRGGFEERDGRRLLDAAGLAQILLASLYGAVRKGLGIAAGIERGLAPADAARAAGVGGAPAVVEREIARARTRDAAAWRARLLDVAELERRSRSGAGVGPDDFALLAVRWRDPRSRPARARKAGAAR